MTEQITVTRKGVPTGGYDGQGAPIIGADTTFPLTIKAFAPRGSDESAESFGPRSISGGMIYGFADSATLLPSDRLTIRGEVWQVEGEVGLWVSLQGSDVGGTEIAVKRAS